jgi:RNA polymerase-binding transcription factor
MSHLSDSDLARLRAALSHKRDELLRMRTEHEAERRGINEPEPEPGDLAEQVIEQDAAIRIGTFDAKLLADVERALKRLEDGTYGLSEISGKPIPLPRLDAIPWARGLAQESR